ncbi:MAG: hypothetical protein C0625_14050 [Arcobacter sp.]|nr:MAG: hypothetical protein C0625_14050 [Arcobacter sp.]
MKSNRSLLTNKKTIILASLAILLFTGCFGGDSGKEEWTSLIYPDKSNTKRNKKFGIYKSLEECKKASIEELINLGLKDKGDYSCGLNCSYHEGMKVEICEQTSK